MKTFALWTATLSLFLGSRPAEAQDALVLTHAVIVDGSGAPPIEDGTLIVRGDTIEAVGPADTISIPGDAEVIDLGGKTVMPGLADMHVHLLGGWDGESIDMLGYQKYLNSLLYAGVTTVLDTGNVLPYIAQMRQEVEAGRILGPRIYFAGSSIDGADRAWPATGFSIASLEQLPTVVQQSKHAGVDVLKAYAGLSDRMVSRLVAEGKKQSLRVFIDQWERNGSIDLMQTGIAAFAHTPTRALSEEAVTVMKEQGIHCITTLAVSESFSRRRLGNLSFLDHPFIKDAMPPWFLEGIRSLLPLKPDELERGRVRFDEALVNAKKLFDAGVLLAAGTDSPYPGVFHGEGLHRELELLVEAGLTPLEAITVATRNAARLMNADEEWGTLAPGKAADVLVIDGHPHKNIGETRNVDMVIQAGRVLDREKLRFDPERDPAFRVSPPISTQ